MSASVPAIANPMRLPRQAPHIAQGKINLHPVMRDLALTMATELSILAAGLFVVSLIGQLLGQVALGEYLLLRRVTAWLITIVLLGMGNALPRFIAHAVKKTEEERRAYFLLASAFLTAVVSVVTLTLYLGRSTFAQWLFGNAQLDYLIVPLGFLLAGLAAQTAAYGYYRGILAMGRANAIQFFHFAVIPAAVVALLYPTKSVALILDVTGILTIVAAVLFALPVILKLANGSLPNLKQHAMELLKYGVGRVPGDFGGAALFAIGPIVATHYLPMDQVAYLLLGSNFLLVMGYTAGPLTVVFLSKFSMMLAQNRMEDVRRSLELMMRAILELSVFSCLQLVVFADFLVRLWVGPKFLPGITVIRLLILAIPPYLFFMALRSGIDAVTVKPRNAGNVLVALAVYMALIAAILKTLPAESFLNGVAAAMEVSLIVLGALTARTFRDLYNLRIPWSRCAPAMIAGLVLAGVSYAFRWIRGFQEPAAEGFLFLFLISGLFLTALLKLRSPWLKFVLNNAFPGRRLA